MLQEIQKWYCLVLSGDEEVAKLLHGFIRPVHFCVVESRNTIQQLSLQFGTFFVDSWADKADTIHIKCARWAASFCFCNSCNHSKAASERVSDGRLLGASPASSAMRLMCGGLVCLGSRDAAVGGVAGTAVHTAGLARHLSQKMTISCLGVPSWG